MKKKKMAFSIFIVTLFVAILSTSLVLVYSANNQVVKSTMNVTYTADHVGATVSATFQKAGTTSATSLTTTGAGGGATSISFAITESTTTRSLSWSSNIEIDSSDPYVLFTYKFHNNATTGADPYYVNLTNGSTGSAFDVYYYKDTAGYTPASGLSSKVSTITSANYTTFASMKTGLGNVSVAAQGDTYLYILVEIKSSSLDANAYYTNSNNIAFTLTHSTT